MKATSGKDEVGANYMSPAVHVVVGSIHMGIMLNKTRVSQHDRYLGDSS